jgi:hypothetical protein
MRLNRYHTPCSATEHVKMSHLIQQWIIEDLRQYAKVWGGKMGQHLIGTSLAEGRECYLVKVEIHPRHVKLQLMSYSVYNTSH